MKGQYGLRSLLKGGSGVEKYEKTTEIVYNISIL